MIYGSFVLAACGWLGSVWSWADHGFEAGVNPGFIFSLTVAATFTMTLSATVVLPAKARIYSLGFQDGVKQGLLLAGDPEPSRLRSVR